MNEDEFYEVPGITGKLLARALRRCPMRGCKVPADVLYEGKWMCVGHVGHDHRPGEPFEAEADGIGESRVPRFGRKR